MNFRDRLFERAMKVRVRRVVNASSALAKELRASKRARRGRAVGWGWLPRVYLLFMVWALALQSTLGEREIALLAGMWTLGMLLHRAAELPAVLYAPAAIAVWGNLPVSDERILLIQMRRFVLKSLWTVFDFSLAYLLLMLAGNVRPNLLWAVFCGFASWFFITAGSLVLFAFLPLRGVRWVSNSLLLGTIALIFVRSIPRPLYTGLYPLVSWVPPLNALWPYSFNGVFPRVWVAPALDALLLIAVALGSRAAWKRIKADYTIEEDSLVYSAYAAGQSFITDDAEDTPGSIDAQYEIVKSSDWLQGLDWDKLGILERGLAHFLTPRERVLLEFLSGGSPGLTSRLRFALWLSAISVALALLLPKILAAVPLVAFGLAGGILATTVGGWGAASTLSGPGLRPPIYACYPIGIWEVVRTQLKINALRWCVLGPLVCLVFELLARSVDPQFKWIGLKALLLWIAINPVFPLFTFSEGTNDTSRPGLVFGCLIPSSVICVLSFFLFAIPEWQALLIAVPVIAVSSTAIMALYCWYFNRSWIDLCPKRLPQI